MLSGGDILIRCLQEENVEHVFGYPGGTVLHIYDALFKQNRLKHVLVRHEQAATHMADGYARSTGRPGVVLVTSGPGATNAITGIATAYMDSIPMVVISGQVQSHLIGSDSFQETDMVGISRPIVKHSFLVKNAKDIPETIKKAFFIATSGRPGPVVVDIPKDITNPTDLVEYEYPEQLTMRSYSPATKGHTGQIKKAVSMLLEAERPVIYAGGGVITVDNFQSYTIAEHGKLHKPCNRAQDKGFKPALQEFVNAVTSGGPAPIDEAELIETSLATIAIMESLREGHRIDLS